MKHLTACFFGFMFFGMLPVSVYATELFAKTVTRDAYGVLRAMGDVEIQYQQENLQAEQMSYDPYSKQLQAIEKVILKNADLEIHAKRLNMNSQSKIGTLFDVSMSMHEGNRIQSSEVQRLSEFQYQATDVDFTACPTEDAAWHIRASEANLDQQGKTLTLKHARFEFYGLPILYTPYWKHPLQRSSGLLTPFVANGVRRGFELSLPYYLAISPTWDATFTPHWMSNHGLKTGLEWRHTSSIGSENIFVESIRDRILNKRRSMLKANMFWRMPMQTQLQIQSHYVDDIYYLADFSNNIQDITKPYLQSRVSLSGQQDGLDWQLWAQHQQDLSTVSNNQTLQILPRLESKMHGSLSILDWQLEHQSSMFQRKQGTDGLRVVLLPSLSLPWESIPGIFSTLEISSQYVGYQLRNSFPYQNLSMRADRFSWENRMALARVSDNKQWRHTWEPVLRYDRVQAPDQQFLPNFDSSNQQLSLTQLLSPNRFSGYDRVEDVNRLSFLLASRLQYKEEQTDFARELFLLRVGFSYDFKRQLVDPTLQTFRQSPMSAILGEMLWQPFTQLSLHTEGQYDHEQKKWSKIQTAMTWNPGFMQQTLLYRFTDTRFSGQEERSLRWQASTNLNRRWHTSASLLYDLKAQQTQQAQVSLRYTHPCWQLNLDAYRIHRPSGTAVQAGDTGVRVQLEFKGLGAFGA